MHRISLRMMLYYLLVLSSVDFFNPMGLINSEAMKLFFDIFFLFLLILAIKKGSAKTTYPQFKMVLIFFGFVTSIFMALFFHEQSLKDSVITIIPTAFAYAFFPLLMRLQIPKEKIFNSVRVFVIMGMLVYIANAVTFPNIIFETVKDEYDMSRGIVRLGVQFLSLFVLLFFYSINQWCISKKKAYITLTILTGIFILLSVTRQIILFSAIFGILIVLQKAPMIKKIIMVGACVALFSIVLPNVSFVHAMVELSSNQAYSNAHDDDDIRVKDYKYFVVEGQINGLSPLFGNGYPRLGKTKYGIEEEKKHYSLFGGDRLFQADVGWAGFFWYFGAFSTIGLLLFFVTVIKKRKAANEVYLSYWFLFIIFVSIASAPILYCNQIICISIVLYLVYGTNSKLSVGA